MQAKLAPLIEKKNHQPDYGNRFAPLAWQVKGAPGHTRQLGEKPYKFMNVARLGMGMCTEADCVEEMQVHKKLYEGFGGVHGPFNGATHAGKGWLIPLHTDYLPASGISENLITEIKQKMAATGPGDIDQQNWLRQKAALGTLADATIGYFVQPGQVMEILEMQYKFEAFSQAGATQIPMMPNGRAFISKIATGSTAGYANEGKPPSGNSMSASNPTASQATLVAKKVYVLVELNNETLRFAMPQTEQMVRKDMAMQAGLFADGEFFTGTGGTHINGLLNQLAYPQVAPPWVQGIDKVLQYQSAPNVPKGIGTNGNTINPEDINRMWGYLPDPINRQDVKIMLTKSLMASIQSRRADAITAGDAAGTFVVQQIMGLDGKYNEMLNNYPVIYSQNIPQNRAKGSATNLTVGIMARFSDVVIARLGVGEIVSNSWADTYWFNDVTGLRMIQQLDMVLRYLASFIVYDYLVNG